MKGLEEIGRNIVDSALKVHKALGPGLLESAYQQCLANELRKRGFKVETEVTLPVCYENLAIDAGYRLDMIVDNQVIVENKAVEQLIPVHSAQIITYLKLGNFRLGYLINWNVPLIKDGIFRFANGIPEPRWRVAP